MVRCFLGLGLLTNHRSTLDGAPPLGLDHRVGVLDQLIRSVPGLAPSVSPITRWVRRPKNGGSAGGLVVVAQVFQPPGRVPQGFDPAQVHIGLPSR